jgi:hypothetical protein
MSKLQTHTAEEADGKEGYRRALRMMAFVCALQMMTFVCETGSSPIFLCCLFQPRPFCCISIPLERLAVTIQVHSQTRAEAYLYCQAKGLMSMIC